MISSALLPYAAAISALVCVFISVLRASRTIAEWAFIAALILVAAESVTSGFCLSAATMGEVQLWHQWRLSLLGLIPPVWLLFSLTYARGNASVFLSRWVWFIATLAVASLILTTFFRDALVIIDPRASTDLPIHIGWSGGALYTMILVGCILVLMNLERTFRAAVGTIRWRIKFVLLGIGVLFLVRIYTTSQVLLFRGFGPSLSVINAAGAIVATIVIMRGLVRSGPFATDVYPSLSVLQGSVTVTLAGVYLVLVGLFGKIVTRLGGDASFALKAFIVLVSLVGLAVLLQSDRVRIRLRRYVSRNFQRPVYDYRAIWRKFTDGTATSVEQTDLCRSIVRTTADIFEALAVSIWLVNEQRDGLVLAASTSVSETKAYENAPSSNQTQQIITHFETHPEAVDIETESDDWAEALRRLHPSDFPTGGNRVCVPLLRQQHLLGVLVMGDRVSGVAFPIQEFDLLKCIGDQASASLLNIQLSQQLLQSKELEAFQTMAAFFVHDLKNAASTLNLTLKNLPVHFDNPEFRDDALRALSKTADHINRLTGRLGLLRHELKIQPVRQDLNDVVAAALTEFKTTGRATITRDLQPLGKVMLDPEQLRKVITNLVLNATEATPPDGTVHIATAQDGNWVVLTVKDTGCGMAEDFLRRSLFRPFKTTKQHGLGIGMFQSRMIVEAHGGRIHVTSQQGKGSTFQIFLPAKVASE